jgi:drug/metabolite transporter (DMT)-like permease
VSAWADGRGFADAMMIAAIVIFATVGDVLIAAAMRSVGDLDEIRARRGMGGAIAAVLGSGRFVAGVFFMALSFFSLLFALSHADLSLVAPASASLTFVTNAVAAKIFLNENVDRRRWIAALFVCAGVALMSL